MFTHLFIRRMLLILISITFYFVAKSGAQFLLGDSKNKSEGIVTMYHPSFGRRKVCGWDWSKRSSDVLCRHLGYTGANETWNQYLPQSYAAIDHDLGCTGSESSIWACPNNPFKKVSSCHGDNYLWVSCN